MIMNEQELNQAIDSLKLLYGALAAMRQDIFAINPQRFALYAEGPQDEIAKLQAEIDEYTGRSVLAELDADVWLRLKGPGLEWPNAPTSVLTAYLDSLRKGVQTVAEFNQAGQLTTRPTKELKRACDLEVSALVAGSLCVGLRVPDGTQMDLFELAEPHPVRAALTQYLAVAEWIASDSPQETLDELIPDSQRRRVLLNAIKAFVPRPRGDVETVNVGGRLVPHGRTIQFTRRSHQRIDSAIDKTAKEQVESHVGDLREIDLDNLSFILRNAGDINQLACAFEEDLLETAKAALDRRVKVTGSRMVESGRRSVTALRVIRLEIVDEDTVEPSKDSETV